MDKDPEQYVTLHGSVLRKIVTDIADCVRTLGWTDEQVQEAIKGAFCTAYSLGGTVNSVDEFADALMKQSGSPSDATKH